MAAAMAFGCLRELDVGELVEEEAAPGVRAHVGDRRALAR
jgi:hypothetical protein